MLKLVLTKEGTLKIDLEDDIVAACRITQDGHCLLYTSDAADE